MKFIVLNKLAIVLKSKILGYGDVVKALVVLKDIFAICDTCYWTIGFSSFLFYKSKFKTKGFMLVANIFCIVLKSLILKLSRVVSGHDYVLTPEFYFDSVEGVENPDSNDYAESGIDYCFGGAKDVPKFIVLNIICIVLKSYKLMLIYTG